MGKYIGARGLNYLWSKTKEGLDGKQNVVEDLADIRSGAAAGATAVQPGDNVSTLANDAHYVKESEMVVPSADTNGHEYVDLGLPSGTLWATMNIGASAPEDYGNYYMYGYTTPYSSSDTPYSGTEDPLSLEHDAARVNWGGDWYMPTKTQFEELAANTTYEWTTINGINGGKFTARNGNYIFIPAAGDYRLDNPMGVGDRIKIMASTPSRNNNEVYCYECTGDYIAIGGAPREYAYSVRGVLSNSSYSPKYATKQELATGLSEKADKSEMSVTPGTGSNADKTTIQLKSGTSATVLTQHQDISGKQDVISDLADIRSGASLGATAVQTETDPTVPSWAKQQSKPSYSYSEISGTPTNVSAFTNDVPYVTESEMVVPSADANGHEYVDLGLPSGTLWATCNVGASAPEGYGNYYMYGYTTPYNSSDTPYSGTEDPLSLEHDAARVNWGGDWRMPTKAQMEELAANTTFDFTTINGLNGGKFTAQNGNYIFIPAAGGWYNGSQNDIGIRGYYFSSTPDSSIWAYYLFMQIPDEWSGINVGDGGSRNAGYPARGVLSNSSYSPKYATKQELNTGLSGKAEKSEMSVTAGTGADADKTTIQLKTGTSATVLTQHQDISGKAEKNEMAVTPGTGTDADKTTITLKTGTSATVLTAHQDISNLIASQSVRNVVVLTQQEYDALATKDNYTEYNIV